MTKSLKRYKKIPNPLGTFIEFSNLNQSEADWGVKELPHPSNSFNFKGASFFLRQFYYEFKQAFKGTDFYQECQGEFVTIEKLSPEEGRIPWIFRLYEVFYYVKTTLNDIAGIDWDKTPVLYYRLPPIPSKRKELAWSKGVCKITEVPSPGVLIESFIDSLRGLSLSRIRLCPICGNIFWASRVDQPGCSKAHSGAVRQRRNREKQKDYEIKRQIKKAKEEKDGKDI